MALSNLVIKTVDRTNLFFNKFGYRVNIDGVPSSYWIQRCKSIDDYIDRLQQQYDLQQEQQQRYQHPWYRKPLHPGDVDLERVDKLLTLINSYNDKSMVTYRHEHENVSVYTNDLSIAKVFAEVLEVSLITEVTLAPDGVKLFKREPPAKFRAYTTNSKMPNDFKQEFIEYLKRTPDIKPSDAFYTYLHRNRGYQSYLWDTYFIDYDDEKNLMMMMLMFPGMIGKKYKLEKK